MTANRQSRYPGKRAGRCDIGRGRYDRTPAVKHGDEAEGAARLGMCRAMGDKYDSSDKARCLCLDISLQPAPKKRGVGVRSRWSVAVSGCGVAGGAAR